MWYIKYKFDTSSRVFYSPMGYDTYEEAKEYTDEQNELFVGTASFEPIELDEPPARDDLPARSGFGSSP